ncbi:MAG TPA: hypothetical protein VG326_01685 [Tepidisphaeraceae bacterium]|nr:hypothetical protein [Tepidisphaeraceae bacterium]
MFVPNAGADVKPQLWLYYPINLLVNANLDKAEKIWTRAAAAGYTHVLIADSKFSRLALLPPSYFKNCERAKKIAADLKLQIVPALFSIGYSNDLLSQDPNLAEGVPVKDQLFVVHDGNAELIADPAVRFDKMAFHDPIVTIDGHIATVKAGKGPARFVYKLTVPEFRCYHISVKIKTDALNGRPEIAVLSGGVGLQYEFLHAKAGEWTQCDVVFDSLNHKDVNVYFGLWSNVTASFQWKDWSIDEVGLVNVLRRPGAPCVVKDEKTGKVLKEGSDYKPIADPHMGNVPYAGEYQAYHAPPVIHTHLPDGQRLRVSWYYPPIIYDGQVAACISEPKTMMLLADQAKGMKTIWDAPLYMMSHDEFRVFGWDESCEEKKQTPGQMLAENVRQCTKMLQPARSAVWNDMFDPLHNAVKGPYYLVNGPWLESWEGLSKEVLVVNWNHGKRDESLKFFAERGNKQLIAGYYDNDLSQFQEWIDSARKVAGVEGYMYTTWRGDYSMLEKFAKMAP